jgi:hypothetical protein
VRRGLGAVIVAGALLGSVSVATGAITEVGLTAATPPIPSCPASPCVALSRTTGFQTKLTGLHTPATVTVAGRIVAWSVTLSQPSPAQVSFFDQTEGGAPEAAIAVLHPQANENFVLEAEGPVTQLALFFGTTVQFPLNTTLPINPGDVIALSVPTWAPVLAAGLGQGAAWRARRGRSACSNTSLLTTQSQIGSTVQYYCLYTTDRLAYTATLIPTPLAPVQTGAPGTIGATGATGASGTTGPTDSVTAPTATASKRPVA